MGLYIKNLLNKTKTHLKKIMIDRSEILKDHKEFVFLLNNIKQLMIQDIKKIRLIINLGPNVYAHAKVPDSKSFYIKVGLGFYIDCSWEEGLTVIGSQLKRIENLVDDFTTSISKTRSQIQFIERNLL